MAGFARVEPAVEGRPFSPAQILHLMKTEFARAHRHGLSLSCVLIEVDRLQSLTELHGLELRDAVRTELGRLVADKTRGHDHVGLARADRCMLLLPHTAGARALGVCERLRTGFAALEVEANGAVVPVTLSFGVASHEAETLFFDTLVSQAEVALDWAIQEGGDRAVLFRKERFLTAGDHGSASVPEPSEARHEDPPGRRREDHRDHPV